MAARRSSRFGAEGEFEVLAKPYTRSVLLERIAHILAGDAADVDPLIYVRRFGCPLLPQRVGADEFLPPHAGIMDAADRRVRLQIHPEPLGAGHVAGEARVVHPGLVGPEQNGPGPTCIS